jgi:cyclic pyranopterin phosphate synthase
MLSSGMAVHGDGGLSIGGIVACINQFQRFQVVGARGFGGTGPLDGLQQARAAGMQIKINMVPLRGQNLDQVLPLLDYCLANGFELRFIELMRMGHLARDGNGFLRQFVGMPELLSMIGEHHAYTQASAPLDATALRYEIPGRGFFGVIANESVPFCRTCSRLRLSSTGWLHGCLSSSNRHYVGDLLDKPRHQALPALQGLLVKALGDKQEVAFSGGATVMKIIGG